MIKNFCSKNLIALFAFLAIATSNITAQTNPYYPNTMAPPTIQQTTNDSTGAIEVNICAPDANRTETFSIYKEINGVRTLVGSGTLENDANLSVTIPNNETTDDMILEVTSKEQNSNAEFIEWRDTVSTYTVANPNNPYDYYGRLHNEALDYFFKNRTKGAMPFSEYKAEAFSLVSDYYAVSNPDNITGNIDEIKEYYYTLEMYNYNTPYDSVFSSPLAADISEKLFADCILNFRGEFTPTTIAPVINAIKRWELKLQNTIENNPNAIPANDVKKLLTQSSILRYSTFYWTSDAANPNGIFNGGYQRLDQIDSLPIDTTGNPTEPQAAFIFSKKTWEKLLRIAVVAIVDSGTANAVASAVAGVLVDAALEERPE